MTRTRTDRTADHPPVTGTDGGAAIYRLHPRREASPPPASFVATLGAVYTVIYACAWLLVSGAA